MIYGRSPGICQGKLSRIKLCAAITLVGILKLGLCYIRHNVTKDVALQSVQN